MNKIAKFIDNERSQPWTIRIVEEGDKYGRDDCLTYEKEEPVIEFYDGENLFDKQASDGTMFPHLYSPLDISNVVDEFDITLDDVGTHVLPAIF